MRRVVADAIDRLDEASEEVEADLQRDFKKLAQRYCPIEAALAATAAPTTFGWTNFTQKF